MKKLFALLGSVTALALAPSANAAVTIALGSAITSDGFFIKTSPAVPVYPITANFSGTVLGANTVFDYFYTFTVAVNGNSSDSLSTSNTGSLDLLTFGMPVAAIISSGGFIEMYTAAQIQTPGGVIAPIVGGVTNTFEIKGVTGPGATTSTFGGTVTFTPGVPEPATWATFLLGFGLLGVGLRRRTARSLAAA